MEIFIHYPESEEGKRLLEHRVAVFHAQYVASRIRRLPCSKEQKLKLVDEIVRKLIQQT